MRVPFLDSIYPKHKKWYAQRTLPGLFRFFDILKPWPIKWLDQHVQGGFGIMIDDVLAGVFAGAVLLLVIEWGWIN